MNKRRRLAAVIRFGCAVCMTLAVFMDFTLLTRDNYRSWMLMMQGHTFAMLALTALFTMLLHDAGTRFPRRGKGLTALAVFLGAWWVLAQVYSDPLVTMEPLATSGQVLKLPVTFVGMTCLYDLLLRMLDDVLVRGRDLREPLGGRLPALYRRRPGTFCGLAVLLVWLVHLIIIYPVAMNADTASQVEQAIGLIPYNGNHPPFSTMVFGAYIALGRAIGRVEFGLFAYLLTQTLLGAAAVGYAQGVLRRLRAPRWLRLITLAACAFSPCYADNVTVILKDVPYTFAALLLCCELARLCVLREAGYGESRGFALRYGAACLVMTLFRNNGLGIVIPLALLLTARMLRARRFSGRLACVLVLPVVLSLMTGAVVRRAFDVQPGSVREGLSLPFQQTARFVRYHADEIPEEEAAIIDEVINYSRIGDFYNPYMSDPVKATIRPDVTHEELMAYLGVWAKQFWRDPLCYVQATLIQNVLLFDPQFQNVAFFDDVGLLEQGQQALALEKPEVLARLSAVERNVRAFLFAFPGYAQLTSVGFYAILMLFCCVVARRERLASMGPLLVIPIATAVMIVLGPCLHWQDRYGFPIIYTMPVILGCAAHLLAGRRKA